MEQVSLYYLGALLGFGILSAALLVSLARLYRGQLLWKKALDAERGRLDAIFESSPIGMVVFDERRQIVRLNLAAACVARGVPVDLLGQRPGVLFQCEHRSQHEQGCGFGVNCWLCPMRKVIESVISGGQVVRGAEVPMVSVGKDGVHSVWLSHEIRTPLNGIIGMTGLLMETRVEDEWRSPAGGGQ